MPFVAILPESREVLRARIVAQLADRAQLALDAIVIAAMPANNPVSAELKLNDLADLMMQVTDLDSKIWNDAALLLRDIVGP